MLDVFLLETVDPSDRHLVPQPGWSVSSPSLGGEMSVVNGTVNRSVTELQAISLPYDLYLLAGLIVVVVLMIVIANISGLASNIKVSGRSFRINEEEVKSGDISDSYMYSGWKRELRMMYQKFLFGLHRRGVYVKRGYTAFEVASIAEKNDIKHAYDIAHLYTEGMFSRYPDRSILSRFKRYVSDEG